MNVCVIGMGYVGRVTRTCLALGAPLFYVAKAFLATTISFINEGANHFEKVGADVTQVACQTYRFQNMGVGR